MPSWTQVKQGHLHEHDVGIDVSMKLSREMRAQEWSHAGTTYVLYVFTDAEDKLAQLKIKKLLKKRDD